MRFAIDGTVYEAASLELISLHDILLLESETAAFGRPITWGQVQDWAAEMGDLTDAERGKHPAALWLLGVTVWAAKRLARESVTFAQAIDFPMAKLTYLPDPQDHKKPAGKAKPRKASGAVVKSPVAAAVEQTETETSEPPSTGD
jgi:hypothetical protein